MLAAAALFAGCSREAAGPDWTDQGRIPITFTLATPGSEGVIYPKTRATHDAAEYAVRQLTLLVYDATDADAPRFLRRHDMAGGDITLYDNGNGTYTFSLEAPISDMNAKRRFVFVVNDDAAVAATAEGSALADLHRATASVALAAGDTADKLAAPDTGIAMSGTATSDGQNEVIVVVPGVKCGVKLTRIVARVDVQNNTPNMTLESAVLVGAAAKGFLFAPEPLAAPSADRIVLAGNAGVDLTERHPVLGPGETFEPKTFKKVFYAYECPAAAGDYAAVRITYRVNDSEGTVEVPFVRTQAGAQTPVDMQRNHLYTVVLGNGQPVTTNQVQFSFKVEEWNVVEMPEQIGPGDPLDPQSQKKLNDALKVNMFTPFNAKTFDLGTKTVSEFYDKLVVSFADCPTASYVTYEQLKEAGLTAADAVLTDGSGNEYRLPTEGELRLLMPMVTEESDRGSVNKEKDGVYYPCWNDNVSTNTFPYVIDTAPFTETVFLKNTDDGYPDKADEASRFSGTSWVKRGASSETVHYYTATPDNAEKGNYNLAPVYGLRFQGTSQYAAYRWETCKIADDPLERYCSIKIKALKMDDTQIAIDDVADEAFWRDGFIEFKFPASGHYAVGVTPDASKDNISNRGANGYCWASSLRSDGSQAYGFGFGFNDSYVAPRVMDRCFPLRLVKVSE